MSELRDHMAAPYQQMVDEMDIDEQQLRVLLQTAVQQQYMQFDMNGGE